MNIGDCLYEIQSIDKELVRLRKKTRELGSRKKNLLNQIVEGMKETGDTEIIHKGKTFTLEEQLRHTRKNDKKRKEDIMELLNGEGFQGTEAEEMYEKISGAMRGPETKVYKLK
jgi:hypothetical protein